MSARQHKQTGAKLFRLHGHVVPDDIWRNATDMRALYLCRMTSRHVPAPGNANAPSLYHRVDQREQFLLNLEPVQNALAPHDPQDRRSKKRRGLAIGTLRKNPRLDMAYMVGAAPLPLPEQWYDYHKQTVGLIYDMAQRHVMTDKEDDFTAILELVQQQMRVQADKNKAKTAEEARNHAGHAWGQSLYSLAHAPKIPCASLTMADNNDDHMGHWLECHNPYLLMQSADAMLLRIVDANVGQDDSKQQSAAAWSCTVERAEYYLAPFLHLCAEDEALEPFAVCAHDIVYRRLSIVADKAPAVLYRMGAPPSFHPANSWQLQPMLQTRRKDIHPLDDAVMMAADELAAKAEAMRRRGPVCKPPCGLLDCGPYDQGFIDLFDDALAARRLQTPQPT